MGQKVKLQYMVVPEKLLELAYVADPVRIKITDSDSIFITGILGETGRNLIKGGIDFWFTKTLANKLIDYGVAELVKITDIIAPTVEIQRGRPSRHHPTVARAGRSARRIPVVAATDWTRRRTRRSSTPFPVGGTGR